MHVIFKINKAKTEFGQSVHIIGNQKAIGSWKVSPRSHQPIKLNWVFEIAWTLTLNFICAAVSSFGQMF